MDKKQVETWSRGIGITKSSWKLITNRVSPCIPSKGEQSCFMSLMVWMMELRA